MNKMVSWIKGKIKYLTEDIWHIPLGELPKRKSFLIREIRIIVLAFKGFAEDKVQLRASALTFNTLLSIVPIVALAFGIAQGFGFDKRLETEIINNFQGHETVMLYVLDLARGFFDNIEPGLMAAVGLSILIWSVMQVLSHIEKSFNHIWQIKKSRPWGRKFADYLSIMLIAPVFLILSGSLTVMISSMIETVSVKITVVNSLKPAIIYLLKFSQFFVMWIVFTLLYLVMPNTRVKFRSAFVAGLIAGTMFQIVQIIYIDFQVGVSKYNAIYGSFAAFPLFIIWMQLSWLIVLLGAEISFANQNVKKYEFESESLKISPEQQRILMLVILNIIVKRFINGDTPLSSSQIAEQLKLPVRLSREIIYNLSEAGVLTEISTDSKRESIYQPGIDPAKLTLHFVLSKLDKIGTGDVPVQKNTQYRNLEKIMQSVSERLKESEENSLIGEI